MRMNWRELFDRIKRNERNVPGTVLGPHLHGVFMSDRWEDDWITFANHVAKLIRDGASSEDLAASFGGHKVRWSGILEEFNPDDVAPSACVAMTPITVNLGPGRSAFLDGLHLSIADGSAARWANAKPGTSLTFVATLADGVRGAVFPPVEAVTLSSGRTLLMIRLYAANSAEGIEP